MLRLPPGTARRLVFSLVPLLLLFLLVEILSLRYFFRQVRPEISATQAAFRELRYAWDRQRARQWVDRRDLPDNAAIFEALYGDEGEALLGEFKAEYAAHFATLARAVEQAGARMLVVYVPPTVEHEMAPWVAQHDGGFLRELAERHDTDFLDLSPVIAAHAPDEISFEPVDFHLTRYGNKVLATEVAGWLRQHASHRSSTRFGDRPELLGDLPPNTRRVWADGNMPFWVQTNSQGLRMRTDVIFPKGDRQRLLLLGDSFTFGYNVSQDSSYPAFLASMFEDREVINAGVPGYSISQEASFFLERARYCEPDLVVLQVLFNDLVGMFSFQRNTFARDWSRRGIWFGRRLASAEARVHVPSELESEFLETLKARPR